MNWERMYVCVSSSSLAFSVSSFATEVRRSEEDAPRLRLAAVCGLPSAFFACRDWEPGEVDGHGGTREQVSGEEEAYRKAKRAQAVRGDRALKATTHRASTALDLLLELLDAVGKLGGLGLPLARVVLALGGDLLGGQPFEEEHLDRQ